MLILNIISHGDIFRAGFSAARVIHYRIGSVSRTRIGQGYVTTRAACVREDLILNVGREVRECVVMRLVLIGLRCTEHAPRIITRAVVNAANKSPAKVGQIECRRAIAYAVGRAYRVEKGAVYSPTYSRAVAG